MNRNTEQLTISSGWVYLESATRYLEHGDFASARVLVEEGILQTEAAPRFDVLGRLRDLHTIPERANGLIVWDQPDKLPAFRSISHLGKGQAQTVRPARQGWEQLPPSLRAASP